MKGVTIVNAPTGKRDENLTFWRTVAHPTRLRVSPLFQAVLAFLLDQQWTSPAIAEIILTSDGHLLVRHEDEIGASFFPGSREDLRDNIRGVSQVLGATRAQELWLLERVESKLTKFARESSPDIEATLAQIVDGRLARAEPEGHPLLRAREHAAAELRVGQPIAQADGARRARCS
jgi:hypothetical protein